MRKRIRRYGHRLLLPLPYHVIDAALDYWLTLETAFEQAEVTRHPRTSGSVAYFFSTATNEPLGGFVLRAIDAQRSLITIITIDEDEALAERLIEIFQQFVAWHEQELAIFNARSDEAMGIAGDTRKTAGRKLLPHNKWAREQFDAGKTVDEILPEYGRRARETPVAARELLRKVYNAWHKRNK
jgi:hypothetical protein